MPAPIKNHPVAAIMRDIRDELASVIFERHDEITAVITALLARHHVMFIGPPGIAKTLTIEQVCRRIVDGKYKAILFDKTMPPEAMLGPWDVTQIAQGRMVRRTKGFLPEADVALFDEIGKSNGAVLNQLLTIVNERMFDNDGERVPVPLLFAGAATNEFLPEELAAFNDRFLVKLIVRPLREETNFRSLLRGVPTTVDSPTMVTREQLDEAYEAIQRVHIPDDTLDRISKLRTRLSDEANCEPSPRRWRWAAEYLRAFAFLHGRDTVTDEDLTCLSDVLWDVPEQREMVQDIVLSTSSETAKAAVRWTRQLGEIEDALRAIKTASRDERNGKAGTDQHTKLAAISKDLKDMIEKSRQRGVPTHRLEEVERRLITVRALSFEILTGMGPEAAREMAETSGKGK